MRCHGPLAELDGNRRRTDSPVKCLPKKTDAGSAIAHSTSCDEQDLEITKVAETLIMQQADAAASILMAELQRVDHAKQEKAKSAIARCNVAPSTTKGESSKASVMKVRRCKTRSHPRDILCWFIVMVLSGLLWWSSPLRSRADIRV